jgi:hypothetical protein
LKLPTSVKWIYGDGVDATRIIQTDTRKDFGSAARTDFKRVPTATIRVRHKGSSVRDLTVMFAPNAPPDRVFGSAAVQIAHINYFPDNNVGIIETTGQATDFLLDFVIVSNVNIGQNHSPGIQSHHFLKLASTSLVRAAIAASSRCSALMPALAFASITAITPRRANTSSIRFS